MVNPSSSLAVRYRPRRFAELTGQRHVAAVLGAAVVRQRLPQQLLLTGGSGLGKTTVARIVAAAALCETELGQRPDGDACGTCRACTLISQPTSQHPDVIELDAASHGGKDEIVAIINRAQTRPLLGPFKVYIIDEVHALSGAGVQAFLKLLEEPPAHVLFMLATTNPEKLSSRAGGTGTIRGRCVEFELLAPTEAELVANLRRIADSEGWSLSDELAAMMVDVSDPALGVRGTVNTLAKLAGPLSSGQEPTTAEVIALLGALPRQTLAELTDAIRQRDLGGALAQLERVRLTSSDRSVRSALVRWARLSLDDALKGRAAVSPELALQRFELLLSAPDGPLHTDLVVARLARPSVSVDPETLSAQLHEAHRVLSRLEQVLGPDLNRQAGADGVPAAGDPDAGSVERSRQEGGSDDASDGTVEDETLHGEDTGDGGATQQQDTSFPVGERDTEDTDTGMDALIAGSFDDLSDLAPEPSPRSLGRARTATPENVPTQASGDGGAVPTPGPAGTGGRRQRRQGPAAPSGAPTRAGSAPTATAEATAEPGGVDRFVGAAARRSVTAAAVARSVEIVVTAERVTLRVPDGLRQRVAQQLATLQEAAEELGATLEVVRADAEVSDHRTPT